MARMYTQGVEIVPGFRLVKPLGRGGFGEVWKATAPGGTDSAIKIISLGERYGFKEFRAVQLVKQIRHPNLVPIIAFWLVNEEGQLFQQIVGDNTMARQAQQLDLIIAMGLGDKNLIDRLRECQKEGKTGIPAEELLNYMEDSAKAIDYLNQPIHDLGDGVGGVNHCDIKPQNILIVGGAAQLCDFGLARVLGDTRVTSAKGSAAYMAPEMISDNKPTRTTDQYFLAISYIELRTGSLPFNVASPAAAIWAHVQGKLDLSKLSPPEQEVIRKATSVDPEKRYDTTMEMVRALRQAIAGGGAGGGTPNKGSRVIKLDELVRPGSEVVPGYKLSKMLGKGGYGQVWEATAPGGKKVALKIIRNVEGVHGRQEFKALELIKSVDHNHLMELHAYWLLDKHGQVIPDEDRDRPDAPEPSILVIASKLANQNLLQRLNECVHSGLDSIPLDELLRYMRQAAEAIDYLNSPRHQLGDRKVSIQHRDIKPENILLAADVVKVGDFGLAKVVEGTSAVIHGDSAGLTLAYAAPEMFTNLVTNWTDQYCLALTYFKLRTGTFPFPDSSKPNDIIKYHIMGKLDLGRLPEPERVVINRATAVKPENRYATCMEMVEDLEKACRHGRGRVQPDAAEDSARRPAPTPPRRSSAPPPPMPESAVSKSSTLSDVPSSEPARAVAHTPAELTETQTVSVESPPSDTSHPVPTPPLASLPKSSSARPVDSSAPTLSHPRPPTSERIVVPTEEQIQVPSVDMSVGRTRGRHVEQRSDGTAEELSQTRGRARPAGAGWKGVEAPRTPRRAVPRAVKVLGMLLLALGAAGVAAVVTWEQWGPRLLDQSDRVRGQVHQLIDQNEFSDALVRVDSWGVRPDVQEELRQKVYAAWLDKGRRLLAEHRYDEASKTCQALLERYPDDETGRQIQATAQRALDIQSAIASGGDFVAVDKKIDDAAAFLDETARKNLRGELASAWLSQSRKELLEERDFARALRTANELARRHDGPEVRKLAAQARLASEVKDLIDKDKQFEKADRTLELSGTELPESLKQSLRGDVLRGWLDQARRELRDRQYEQASRSTSAVLARFAKNADALAIRKTIGHEVLAEPKKTFDAAVARLKKDPKDEEGLKGLNLAVAGAVLAQRITDDPQAYVIRGQASELLGDYEKAFAAYNGGLNEPSAATFEQLELLLARTEYLINPKWEDYLKRIGYTSYFLIEKIVKASDRAMNLVEGHETEPATKARALALGGLSRLHAIRKIVLDPEKLKQYQEEAVARLKTALQLKADHANAWLWRYELARLYNTLMIGAPEAERVKLRSEAVQLLKDAYGAAPADDSKQKIQTLLKEMEKR